MAIRVLLLSLCCLGPFSLRLVGGDSRCQGEVQLQRPGLDWTSLFMEKPPLEFGSRVCLALDCGSALFSEVKIVALRNAVKVNSDCEQAELIDCFLNEVIESFENMELKCSDSVRLIGGSGLCSGSLQILDQSWISVCEGALDLQGAEVLCQELGCGDPSVLQGELSSPSGLQVELSPLGLTFHCEGHESSLMDCIRSTPKTCSSGLSVGIICSEPLRLVGGASRCAGTVELRHRGEWRRVVNHESVWTEEDSAAVCSDLDCGSAVSGVKRGGFQASPLWWITSDCIKRKSKVRECVIDYDFFITLSRKEGVEVMCSDLLHRPVLSLSVTVGVHQVQVSQVQVSQIQVSQIQVSQVQVSQVGVQVVRVQLGSQFLVQCSVKRQFPGGSFQLLSPSGNHTLPAVNHSAHFRFNRTGPAHKGDYTCVYHLQVFNHSFSSESERLELRLGVLNSDLIIRALIILLMTLMYILPMYYCYYDKAKTRGGAKETSKNLILMNEVITDTIELK